MKSLLTILILTSIHASGQEYSIEYGDKKYMNYHYYCSHNNGFTLKKKLADGKYTVYSKEFPGITIIEGYYKSRKRTGNWTIYDPSDKSTEYQTYEDGELRLETGTDSLTRKTMFITHTTDSIISTIYSYDYPVNFTGVASCVEEGRQNKKDKVYISKSTCYYPSGQLNQIYRYKNGDSHGKSIEYYENGEVKMEFENWNGRQVGLWKWYNDKGELTKEKDFGPK